jgi:hypothetical protein
MPQERVTMRKIEILRLALSCSQSRQTIAISCGVGKTTVTDTLSRAYTANLSWPLPFSLDDEGLEALLYAPITAEIIQLSDRYNGFEDPGRSLPKEITEITGITDDMVHGLLNPSQTVQHPLLLPL